jgi:uncharacterized membrane protein
VPGVGVVLSLLAALAYGTSDFVAGTGARRTSVGRVTLIAQPFGLVAAVIAVAAFPAAAPGSATLLWGALSGVGSGLGTVALYQGLAAGRMGVVAPLSAVVTAAVPAVVGLLSGERLTAVASIGLGLALPAVALVSAQRDSAGNGRWSALWGSVAGGGFALMFVALDRAGTDAGAWPLVPGQAIAVLVVLPIAARLLGASARWRDAAVPGAVAGLLAGAANLLFLAATGAGDLAVVAVLTALYPAITVVLARGVLGEHWTGRQVLGLVAAGVAVAMITMG